MHSVMPVVANVQQQPHCGTSTRTHQPGNSQTFRAGKGKALCNHKDTRASGNMMVAVVQSAWQSSVFSLRMATTSFCIWSITAVRVPHRGAAGVLVLDGAHDARLAPVDLIGQRSVVAVPETLDVQLLALPAGVSDLIYGCMSYVKFIISLVLIGRPRMCIGVLRSTARS